MTLKKWALILIPVGLVLLVLGIVGYVAMTDLSMLFGVGAVALVAGIVAALTSAFRRESR